MLLRRTLFFDPYPQSFQAKPKSLRALLIKIRGATRVRDLTHYTHLRSKRLLREETSKMGSYPIFKVCAGRNLFLSMDLSAGLERTPQIFGRRPEIVKHGSNGRPDFNTKRSCFSSSCWSQGLPLLIAPSEIVAVKESRRGNEFIMKKWFHKEDIDEWQVEVERIDRASHGANARARWRWVPSPRTRCTVSFQVFVKIDLFSPRIYFNNLSLKTIIIF